MKGYRFEYSIIRGFFGGEHDKCFILPSVCVYVPERDVVVFRDPYSDTIAGPPDRIYVAVVGDGARVRYETLLSEARSKIPKPQLAETQVEEVEVYEDFIAWANAANRFRNPSSDITDLLRSKQV